MTTVAQQVAVIVTARLRRDRNQKSEIRDGGRDEGRERKWEREIILECITAVLRLLIDAFVCCDFIQAFECKKIALVRIA